MAKYRILLWLLILVSFSLPVHAVFADIGPKPTMEFEFELPDGVTIISGIMYECDESDCSDAAPIEELGPQGFRCDEFHCSSTAYGYAPYHRIEIQFSDGKTLQSNIFETIDFTSNYRVTVNADDLSVDAVSGEPAPPFEDFPAPSTPQQSYIFYVLGCVCILLLIGLITAVIIFFILRSRKK